MTQKVSAKRNLSNVSSARVMPPIVPGPKLSNEDFSDLCKGYAAEAVTVLVGIMRDPEAAASSRTAAAVTVIERGFGRAPQQINTTHTDMTALHLEALRQVAAASREKVIEATPIEPLPVNPFQVTDKSSDPT